MKPVIRSCFSSFALAIFGLVCTFQPAAAQTDGEISPEALQQIRALLQEKESRTPTMGKLGSGLVYALKASTGELSASGVPTGLQTDRTLDITPGGVLVELATSDSGAVSAAITQAGGRVIYSSALNNSIRARVPLGALESLASRSDVARIKPAARAKTSRSYGLTGQRGFLRSALPQMNLLHRFALPFLVGSVATQGDIAHAANTARSAYGVNGSGVRVGVLSDSAEALPFLIGTGDLAPDTINVADIIDGPGSSEGTAMMEIIHDMAPGARIFFASAFNSPSSFADNIRTLRNVYGCDVIVDDVSYSDESPFQDSEIARAVNDVTASGAIYFSSAGNSGNITSSTSSAWEGDFSAGGTSSLLPGYRVHSFGTQLFNRIPAGASAVDLFWSDPLGASSNDYDLFVLNSAGTALLYASTDLQNGTQDPFEEIYVPLGMPANARIVIAAKATAATRALHLDTFSGDPLSITTSGNTRGHNAAAAAVGVAAVGWNSARLGTRPFVGGAQNPTEPFSSDGPRTTFYAANGTPITPNNFLFGTGGGVALVKPDISAADGVTTRTPEFSPFFGTSAAAPHAAAIAALVKSARPSFTPAQIRDVLRTTTLDIRATGPDRDAGYGLVMAPAAVAEALRRTQ